MKTGWHHQFRHFIGDTRGVAGVEFAVVIPVILLMFLGVIEVSNYVMVNQRTEKMAYSIADNISQADTITLAELNTILDASSEIMSPYTFSDRGHVIVTAVKRDVGAQPRVAWQYEGGGTLSGTESEYGALGTNSPLPAGFTLNERETVIIAEVFYTPRSLITNMFSSDEVLYKYAFYKPRLGALDTISSQ
jgi:Flp pilus assembly protein TadG